MLRKCGRHRYSLTKVFNQKPLECDLKVGVMYKWLSSHAQRFLVSGLLLERTWWFKGIMVGPLQGYFLFCILANDQGHEKHTYPVFRWYRQESDGWYNGCPSKSRNSSTVWNDGLLMRLNKVGVWVKAFIALSFKDLALNELYAIIAKTLKR